MSDTPSASDRDAPLNPALKSRTETTYDTKSSAAPADTASVQREEGRAWPMIWLIVALICVAITIYLLV